MKRMNITFGDRTAMQVLITTAGLPLHFLFVSCPKMVRASSKHEPTIQLREAKYEHYQSETLLEFRHSDEDRRWLVCPSLFVPH